MPTFVSEGTEDTVANPTQGASVQLVARVESDQFAALEEWITSHDGEILDSLDRGFVEFELAESHVAALCDLEFVRSVERTDEAIEVLDPGN